MQKELGAFKCIVVWGESLLPEYNNRPHLKLVKDGLVFYAIPLVPSKVLELLEENKKKIESGEY